MNASFRIEQVSNLLDHYRDATHRTGMRDLAIWQSLADYYHRPEDHDLIVTSTREEAFERMVADNWTVYSSADFYGLDYVLVDELVLNYLIDNNLAVHTQEES